MKYFLFVFLTLLGISNTQNSCTPKELNTSSGVSKEDLLGKWQWVLSRQERRGSGTTETTPKDLGKTMQVEFLADGKLNLYHDGQLVLTNTYELATPGSEQQCMLKVTSPDPEMYPNCESGPLYLEGKKLTIAGGYNDAGSTQIFEKMK